MAKKTDSDAEVAKVETATAGQPQTDQTERASENATASDAAVAQEADSVSDAGDNAAKTDEPKTDQPELVPANAAVTDPSPAAEMDPASGAFVEPAVLDVGADHPAVETNPRAGTTAVQNGVDWNDPKREPGDDHFLGQGLDLSVYGADAKK